MVIDYLPPSTGFCYNNILLSNMFINKILSTFTKLDTYINKLYTELSTLKNNNEEYLYIKYNNNKTIIDKYIDKFLFDNLGYTLFTILSNTQTFLSYEFNNNNKNDLIRDLHLIKNDSSLISKIASFNNQLYTIILPFDYYSGCVKYLYDKDLDGFIRHTNDYIKNNKDIISNKLVDNELFTHISFIDFNFKLMTTQFLIKNIDDYYRLFTKIFVDLISILKKNKVDVSFTLIIKYW